MDRGIEHIVDVEEARTARRQARSVQFKSLAATLLVMVAVMLLL